MAELELGARRKIYCNTCRVKTNHELKFVHLGRYDEHVEEIDESLPPYVYWQKREYRLWVCLGCDTAILEDALTREEWVDRDGNQEWESFYYPRRARQDLRKKHFRRLGGKLASIYREVIESFNAGLKVLCAVGLRALLEGICADKGITEGMLHQKIDKLDGYLPPNIVQSLHGFRFMGNEAAHNLQAPKLEELRLAIEVMEDLLNFLYELDYKARMLPQKQGRQ